MADKELFDEGYEYAKLQRAALSRVIKHPPNPGEEILNHPDFKAGYDSYYAALDRTE